MNTIIQHIGILLDDMVSIAFAGDFLIFPSAISKFSAINWIIQNALDE